MLEQDNYFAVTIKLNVCYRQTHCIDGQEKVQYIKDTDNEFAQFQTPRKKLQSIGTSLASLHAFMKTLKRYFRNIQSRLFENSESVFSDKNDMKHKVNGLVRLHKKM